MTTTRRKFLKGGLTVGGLAAASQLTSPFIRTATAGKSSNSVVFASGEPLSGNWDPSSHTVLGQINFEGYVFGRLTNTPMRPENPSEIQYTSQTLVTTLQDRVLTSPLRTFSTLRSSYR